MLFTHQLILDVLRVFIRHVCIYANKNYPIREKDTIQERKIIITKAKNWGGDRIQSTSGEDGLRYRLRHPCGSSLIKILRSLTLFSRKLNINSSLWQGLIQQNSIISHNFSKYALYSGQFGLLPAPQIDFHKPLEKYSLCFEPRSNANSSRKPFLIFTSSCSKLPKSDVVFFLFKVS